MSDETKVGGSGVLLGREHLLAAEFASKDASRYQITGVHVNATGAVEATNGHYAIRVPASTIQPEEFPEVAGKGGGVNGAGLLIPSATCKEALKALPRADVRAAIPVLGLAHLGAGAGPGMAVLTTTDLETSSPRTVKAMVGQFPDLDQVIPTDDTDRIVIGMNAEYLKRIAEYALKVAGKRDPVIALSIPKDPAKASENAMRWDVKIGEDGRTATITLMPMRLK